jgi:hypothetical protein
MARRRPIQNEQLEPPSRADAYVRRRRDHTTRTGAAEGRENRAPTHDHAVGRGRCGNERDAESGKGPLEKVDVRKRDPTTVDPFGDGERECRGREP